MDSGKKLISMLGKLNSFCLAGLNTGSIDVKMDGSVKEEKIIF